MTILLFIIVTSSVLLLKYIVKSIMDGYDDKKKVDLSDKNYIDEKQGKNSTGTE